MRICFKSVAEIVGEKYEILTRSSLLLVGGKEKE